MNEMCEICNKVTEEKVYPIPINVDIMQHIPKVHSRCKAIAIKYYEKTGKVYKPEEDK